MTCTESIAINTVFRWLLRIERPASVRHPTRGEIQEAMALLADHADRTLSAGLTADLVRTHFPRLVADLTLGREPITPVVAEAIEPGVYTTTFTGTREERENWIRWNCPGELS